MSTPEARDGLFDCGGEMAQRFASFDWSRTPLGPPATWPASLRTACALMLHSRFPMILSWGEDLVMLYNDAYIPTLRGKHPQALGSPMAIQFEEIWDEVGPMQRSVQAGGAAAYHEDLPLVIDFGLGPEEGYFTFSYSHVPNDDGPGGVLTVFADTTGKVVGARRLGLLNALAGRSADVRTPEQALGMALDLLGSVAADLQQGACYVPGADGSLARAGGFGEVPADWPTRVPPDAPGALGQARTEERVVVESLEVGPEQGESAARHRAALPLRARGELAAVLLVTPHPLRPMDDDHRRFLDLLADQVGQAVSLATARADEQGRLEAMAAIDAAKSELLSSVSHEFRTPLTLLLGPLEDALDDGLEQLDTATIRAMHQGAHRLLRLVNDLLDVARIDAGGVVVEPEPTDLSSLTAELLAPFRGASARSGLSLAVRVAEELGTVETDPRLWEKILLNLVSNAVKYTHRGGITVDVGVEGSTPGGTPGSAAEGEIVLRVSDTGIGIPAEELDRVFERFHRVSGAAGRSTDGTGLGLALVAEAAQALGGSARATSGDTGSRFEVRLPWVPVRDLAVPVQRRERVGRAAQALAGELAGELAESLTGVPAADASGATLSSQAPRELASGAGPATILVVDDNHAMRTRLRRVLDELGEVVACTNGEEALAVLQRTPVSLVVTDVMMPKLDGVGLLQAIRADTALAHTPVVVLSARAGPEAATGALQEGADDYVVKPFTRSELLARCRTNLELSRLRAEATAARTRTTLIAGVSHDMQTPLSVVRSALEILVADDVDADVRAQLAGRALPRAAHLERLVQQFLDWSRLAVGAAIVAERATTDLVRLVDGVASEYPELTFAPPDVAAVASCDPARTRQILHSLAGNAVRAARGGVEVSVRAVEAGSFDIEVRDDGPGVAAHVLPHLFAPFCPSTRADGRGGGLGLHVSREAARAQGGELFLASSDERGASFVLRVTAGD